MTAENAAEIRDGVQVLLSGDGMELIVENKRLWMESKQCGWHIGYGSNYAEVSSLGEAAHVIERWME